MSSNWLITETRTVLGSSNARTVIAPSAGRPAGVLFEFERLLAAALHS